MGAQRDIQFQTKYNEPLPNTKVENLARTMCVHSRVYIRDIMDWSKVPRDAKHQFREYACELAEIVGVDGHSNSDESTATQLELLRVAALLFINKVESGRAISTETYGQLKEAMELTDG